MTVREVHFGSLVEKAQWIDAAASLDAASPTLQQFVHRLVIEFARRGVVIPLPARADDVARLLHAFVRDSIRYVPDRVDGRRVEELASSREILLRGYDDCDGKVRLFVALIRALGRPDLQARVLPVFPKPDEFRHVQAEIRAPHLAPTERDGWTRAELIVEGVGIGDDPERARRPDRSFPMSGSGPRASPLRALTAQLLSQ